MFANYQKTEFQVCSVENGLILYTMHADRAVKSWGFDEESGDAVIVYEDGSALAAQIF